MLEGIVFRIAFAFVDFMRQLVKNAVEENKFLIASNSL
jgi:hypothetical protein